MTFEVKHSGEYLPVVPLFVVEAWPGEGILVSEIRYSAKDAHGRERPCGRMISSDAAQHPEDSHGLDWLLGQATSVFQSCGDAIIGKGLDGTILSWSPGAERLFGYTVEEAVGSPISMLVPPDRAAEEPDILTRLAKGECFENLETKRISKDGRKIDVSLTITPIRDRNSKPIGAAEIARDISAQKRAENQSHLQGERLDIMLRSIGDGVIATDVRGYVDFLNPVAESLTGWTQQDAKGLPLESVFNIINESSRCRVECPAARALRDGTVVGLANHTLLISKNGGEIAIDDSAAPIRDRNGKVSGVILVFRDVSGSRAVENMRAKLSAIVESSDDAIVGKDLEGRIVSWNRGAERVFGYSQQEAVGRSITMLIPPDRLKEEELILSRLRRGERVEHFETIRITKQRRKIDVSVTVSPILDSEGHVVGASKIARDISDRKRAEKELALANEALKRHAVELETQVALRTAQLRMSLEEMEIFSSSLSHDLKSPLRTIAGYTQTVREDYGDQLPEDARALLDRAVKTCSRLGKLIDDVLSYARIGSGQLHFKRIDLTRLVSRIVEDAVHGVDPAPELRLETPFLPVLGHEGLLTQAVANLVSNGLKFVPPGTRPNLRIWTEARDHRVRLWVEDNGIGIPDADQPKVFGLFTRLDNAERYEGTGVGLAVVQRAARRMGGDVGLFSVEGRGSKFWMELPSSNRDGEGAGRPAQSNSPVLHPVPS